MGFLRSRLFYSNLFLAFGTYPLALGTYPLALAPTPSWEITIKRDCVTSLTSAKVLPLETLVKTSGANYLKMTKWPFKLPQVIKILTQFIPNPFKFAISIMNVTHSNFNIPHSEQFFILVFWMIFTFLVSYMSTFAFLSQIQKPENTPTFHFTIHVMKVVSYACLLGSGQICPLLSASLRCLVHC